MTLQTTITVAPGQSGRLDKQLAQLLPTVSRSQLQKWIDDGQVLVNGQAVKAKFKLAT